MEDADENRRSSGQQILETIQPIVGHLTSFIRQGAWVFGPFGPGPPRDYSESEIKHFISKPGALLELRKQSETRVNHSFEFFISSSSAQANMRSRLTQEMKRKLQNPALESIIIRLTARQASTKCALLLFIIIYYYLVLFIIIHYYSLLLYYSDSPCCFPAD